MIRSSLILVAILTCLPAGRTAGQHTGEVERGIALFESGREAEAEEIFRTQLDRDQGNHTAAFYLGRILYDREEYDEAADWLEKAVAAEDDNVLYHQWVLKAYERQAQSAGPIKALGILKRTLSELERVLELDPRAHDERRTLAQFYLRVPGLLGGDRDRALELIDEAASLDRPTWHLMRADLFDTDKEYDRAEQEYRTLISEYPDDPGHPESLAYFYLDQDQDRKAVNLLLESAARFPDDLSTRYSLGRACALTGLALDEGEAALQAYLASEPGADQPTYADAHWRLGLIEEHRGDTDAARTAYETALRLEPDHRQARRALRKLKDEENAAGF